MSIAENIRMIEAQNDTMWFEGAPAAICAVRLALDVTTGEVFTTAKWLNLWPGVVQSIVFDVICYDAFRHPLTRLIQLRFDGIEAGRNTSFGYEWRIEVPELSTRNVEYILQQVVYADGTAWHNPDDRRFDTRLEQESIYTVQGHYNKQFLDICARSGIDGVNLVLQPVFERDHWLCACGAFNWANEENCSQCRINKVWLQKSTDPALLRQKQQREEEAARRIKEQVATYGAQEDQEAQKAEFEQRRERYQQELRQQKRQATRKRIVAGIAVLLAVAAAAYLLMTFAFPEWGKACNNTEHNSMTAVSAPARERLPLGGL